LSGNSPTRKFFDHQKRNNTSGVRLKVAHHIDFGAENNAFDLSDSYAIQLRLELLWKYLFYYVFEYVALCDS